MSIHYLASVIVYNLLPRDYDDTRIAEIEDAISSSISSAAKDSGAADGNIFFSFPQDPSVEDSSVPLKVEVQLYFAVWEDIIVAKRIKEAFLSLPGEKRGDIFVEVRGAGVCSRPSGLTK